MHPTFKHVPPKVEYFSINATFFPNCDALIAEMYPPGPEPITMISYFIAVCLIKKLFVYKNTIIYQENRLIIVSLELIF